MSDGLTLSEFRGIEFGGRWVEGFVVLVQQAESPWASGRSQIYRKI